MRRTLILAIETTGAHASVAWIDEEGRLGEVVSEGELNHLQALMPMTEKLLKNAGICASDLTCIAASEGPGSFTGIRIGVSSARALAQTLNIPALSVPTQKAFAYNAPNFAGVIAPIFDARRSQVYGSAYRWNPAGGIDEILPAQACDLGYFLDLLKGEAQGEILFFGDGVDRYREQIEQWKTSLPGNWQAGFAEAGVRYQKASSVAKLARTLYKEGKATDFEQLRPVYLRKAEAERKLEEGLLGKNAGGGSR